jgi:protein-tyrosine phosphatase
VIDFHNHLLARVDDGASDAEQSRSAVLAMREQGVRGIVVTPHLVASTTERPDLLRRSLELHDEAYEELAAMVASDFADVRLYRGVELMLDSPSMDLSDPRLRLAGTKFVLVEFPGMMVPPHSVHALFQLRERGWLPVVAHPERYHNLDDLVLADEWRSVGAFLQCNAGSVVGRYGPRAEAAAWDLLEQGWVDYLCSDYHARGRLPIEAARAAFEAAGGAECFDVLTRENPSRLVRDEEPLPVPPLLRRRSLWQRLRGRT